MAETARRPSVDDQANADSGSDRDVGKIVEAAPSAPSHLGKRGPVDVGIEQRRHSRHLGQPRSDVGMRPAGLGGRPHLAVGRGCRVDVDRAEARNAEGLESGACFPFAERGFEAAERLFGCRRRHRLASENIAGAGREDCDALGAAQFDARVGHSAALSRASRAGNVKAAAPELSRRQPGPASSRAAGRAHRRRRAPSVRAIPGTRAATLRRSRAQRGGRFPGRRTPE